MISVDLQARAAHAHADPTKIYKKDMLNGEKFKRLSWLPNC